MNELQTHLGPQAAGQQSLNREETKNFLHKEAERFLEMVKLFCFGKNSRDEDNLSLLDIPL